MKNAIGFSIVGICLIFLGACSNYQNLSNYQYSSPRYQSDYSRAYFFQNIYRDNEYTEPQPSQEVQVPSSYHLDVDHSPVSFKDLDRSWFNSQNAEHYTIEMANDEKASQVARKLYQAPKSQHSAQIPYQQQGKTYYKGLYGSYDNAEAAQKALENLPGELKQGARIERFGTLQGHD